MKEKVWILDEIFPETQARYPHVDLHKFETLYSGWKRQGMRQGRKGSYYSYIWKRGYLSKKDAEDLRKYIGLT